MSFIQLSVYSYVVYATLCNMLVSPTPPYPLNCKHHENRNALSGFLLPAAIQLSGTEQVLIKVFIVVDMTVPLFCTHQPKSKNQIQCIRQTSKHTYDAML